MNGTLVLKGQGITQGVAEGEALVSKQSVGFSDGIEANTELVADKRHEWLGQNVKGKVIVFPYGKSLSIGGNVIREAIKFGNAAVPIVSGKKK